MLKLTVTAAALLLGVVSAMPKPDNDTDDGLFPRATSFWYSQMDHTGNYRGYAPDLDNDFNYAVYASVNPGDGNAIQNAINAATNGAKRNGQWFASQPRVRRLPRGKHLQLPESSNICSL